MIIEILDKQYEAEEDYEPIFIDGRKYKPLKIYKNRNSLKDMILCVDVKNGCKACFHEIDKGREPKKIKMSDAVAWTLDEIELIKNELRRGKLPCEIAMNEKLNRHTQNATYVRARDIKNNMIYKKELKDDIKRGPRFKVRF